MRDSRGAAELTVGVWFELRPGSVWAHEGITRLVRLIAEGAVAHGARLVFAIPSWMWESMPAYLDDLPPPVRARIELLAPARHPALVVQWRHRGPRARRPAWLRRLGVGARRAAGRGGRFLLRHTAATMRPRAALPLLALGTALLPVAALALAAARGARRAGRRVAARLRRRLAREVAFARQTLGARVYRLALAEEFRRLARLANARRDVACWLVPHPSWTGATALRAPVVSLFPDFVFGEYPGGYSPADVDTVRRHFRELQGKASAYITFCEHVRAAHAVGLFGIPPGRVVSIPHAPTDLARWLPFLPADRRRTEASAAAAASILRRHVAAAPPPGGPRARTLVAPYVRDLPFEDLRYVFVSTQNRPYKNTLRVIQAVEHLIRREFVEVKLIMTGALDLDAPDDPLGRHVAGRRLHRDVFSLPQLPAAVHAAAYHCASVAVHASFFEGGLPFVFSEAVSVGTPVLLARMPATLEAIGDAGLDEMLFDPYDVDELAARIRWVLEHRAAALDRQWPLWERLATRSWAAVGGEYLAVLRRAAAEAEAPR